MRRLAAGLILLSVSLTMPGCMSLKYTFSEDQEQNVVYLGTRESLSCLGTLCPRYGWIPLLVDLPLSMVMDTALLPYSIYKTARNHEALGPPVLVQLPLRYHGWVVLRYEDFSCSPFEEEEDHRRLVVDNSGRACTASTAPPVFNAYRFEGVSEDGKKRIEYREDHEQVPGDNPEKAVGVWDRFRARPQKNVVFPKDRFFVGTKEEFLKSARKTPDLRDAPPTPESPAPPETPPPPPTPPAPPDRCPQAPGSRPTC